MNPMIGRWLRINLFNSVKNGCISIVLTGLCAYLAYALLRWAFLQANWDVVGNSMRVFMAGTYPAELLWRPWLSALILVFLSGASLGLVSHLKLHKGLALSGTLLLVALLSASALPSTSQLCYLLLTATLACLLSNHVPGVRRLVPWLWVLGMVVLCCLMSAAGTERWGGLLVSVLVTIVAAAFSLPLGILLALGKCSKQPGIRCLCTAYIETLRAIPLILVVYSLWVLTPLILPQWNVPDLARGVLGFTLFFAAYVAEYVRSGLQSVPAGQVEAAQALGMRHWQINADVVLPQALRVSTPALIGNVLDIFNNIPLLFIIGMTDFLRAGQMVLLSPQAGGHTYEIYAFMFVVYMVVASIMTYGSRRLEDAMNRGRHEN